MGGDILYVEHLEQSFQMMAEYIKNLIGDDKFGIRTLEIDRVAFASGILTVKEVDCIFPDGSFVHYKSSEQEYSLSYEMQSDDAIQGKQLYLGLAGEDPFNREIKLQDNTVINMLVYNPKLAIFNVAQENRVDLIKIVLKGGSFMTDEECTRLLEVDVKKPLDSLIFNLQNLFLVESDKSEIDSLFLSHINCAIANLMQILDSKDPIIIYRILLSCLGSLSWKTGKPIQISGNYSMIFPLKSINMLFQKINEVLDYLSVSYKKVEFVQSEGLFVSTINNFEQYENLIIVAEPFSEEGIQELFSCVICSESFLQDARKKRTFAMPRKKQKDEMKFIVPLSGPFFNSKEKIVCDIVASKFTRIAFYVK